MSESLVIGIDLGGTKTRVGVVNRADGLLRVEITPTMADAGPEAVLEHIRDVAKRLAVSVSDVGTVEAAAIGAPGPMDLGRGVVSTMPNLVGWENFPLQAALSSLLEMPVAIANDADAAALGEQHFGAGRGASYLLYIGLGTGVGGGIIIDGKRYIGSTGAAAEIGHMQLDPAGPTCSCGRRGCLEAFASGGGLARMAERRIARGGTTRALELAGGLAEDITASHLADAARRGDALAEELLTQGATRLSQAIVSLVHTLNPDLVLFGGGLLAIADLLIDPAVDLARPRIFPQHLRGLRFGKATLGDDAGVLGAASLALDALGL